MSLSYNPGENAFITRQGDDSDEIKAHGDGLANGAAVGLIPPGPAPFAPLYGMLASWARPARSSAWSWPVARAASCAR